MKSCNASFKIDIGWSDCDGFFYLLPSLRLTGREIIFDWLFAYVDIYRTRED